MKTMTIGISPEYNYPGLFSEWTKNNTYYAANHGASLITRAIMREFNADYIDDFSDLEAIKNKYDTCIMALATHAHSRRDISQYVDILEKLQVRVIIISLGVEDYLGDVSEVYELHPSVKRLLNLASESSSWLGVRGPYTASVLQQNGFKNALPVGCPSVYWNMKPDFEIHTKCQYDSPLVVYHRSIARESYSLIKDFELMGQDFQDEAIFTSRLNKDYELINTERKIYASYENSEEVLAHIKVDGYFPNTFNDWFSKLGQADFVFGPRLHGVIGSLIQGVPAVLTTRDLRTREMSEVFNIPSIEHEKLVGMKFRDIVEVANFDKFKETYKKRFFNYVSFISENKIVSNFSNVDAGDATINYNYLMSDIQSSIYLNNIQLMSIKQREAQRLHNQIQNFLRRVKNFASRHLVAK